MDFIAAILFGNVVLAQYNRVRNRTNINIIKAIADFWIVKDKKIWPIFRDEFQKKKFSRFPKGIFCDRF